MKIQICSDLHLEIESHRKWFEQNPLIPRGDILIIAGDTYHLDRDFSKLEFIRSASDQFESVYLIPGNHEYYGGYDISTAMKPSSEKVLDNVFIVNNHQVEIDNVQCIFSTMWSRIQRNILEVLRYMPDFTKIKFENEDFNINHFNQIHQVAFDFISKAVKSKGKKVVVTHHLPSNSCNVEEFKNSIVGDAFCVDKTNFILDHEIDYWIYGHSHRNLQDFEIGGTKMVTNQFGYLSRGEHKSFLRDKTIEL